VIPPKNEEVFGIFDLIGKEKADSLEALFATIHVVAQKQVVGIRGKPAVLEQTKQIVVLTVNVTTDFDWRLQFQQNRLTDEDFSGFHAQATYLLCGQLYLFARTASTNLQEPFNNAIYIDVPHLMPKAENEMITIGGDEKKCWA